MKNSDTPQNPPEYKGNSQNENTGPKRNDPNSNPYDSENLDKESDAGSKDITEKDIERDLIENDPSEGFETHIDTSDGDKAQGDSFETIGSDNDNPVHKELEIGRLSSEDLKEDEQTRDETTDDSVHFNKRSERNF